jgi:hypothetical protein
MSSKLLKKQLRTFVNQEKADSAPSRKILPSKVVNGTFKVHRDSRKKQRQMLQLQSKSASYTQQRLAIEQENMKHNLFVFNRSNQPTEHQLEVAQLLLPKKVTHSRPLLHYAVFCFPIQNLYVILVAIESHPSRKARRQSRRSE